jgi:glyoxylase-like metal-dependent hydrolase (beta-lactamase superfamily II)
LKLIADHISVRELQDLIAAGRPVNIVDVRSSADVDWAIPGSTHVDAYDALKSGRIGPLAELTFAPGPVVTVCGVGQTAKIATRMLRARGVEASTLEGGMRAWSLAWNIAEGTIGDCDVVQVRRTGKGCLSYIVASQAEAVVIDASVDPDVYVRLLAERGCRLVAVVDTHVHADHLSRSRLLAQITGADLFMPAQYRVHYQFRSLDDAGVIQFGSAELVALRTPGHSSESTTYLLGARAAFTGDTLFLSGVGRPDLEGRGGEDAGRNARLLHESIGRLLKLPSDTLVLPGHVSDPILFDHRLLATTIGTISDAVAMLRMDADAFIETVLARIPPTPPNHFQIVELNERGELPHDPSELEAGANRCAIA